MGRNYGGVIWTNHALQRLSERGIKQGDAWATFSNPQESRKGKIKDSWVYFRNYGNNRIEVVATQNEKRQWIILSVWSKFANHHFEESLLEKIVKKLVDFLLRK